MNSHQTREVWERYVSSWRAPEAEQRRAIFSSCLSPGCIYRDPLAVAEGWEALEAYMLAFHQQIPGGHFVTEEFHAHHRRSIARWRMVGGDGVALGTGMSYGEYDEEGRLVAMTGFFETAAAGATA